MEPDEYRRLSELESSMWWFRGMERITTAVLESRGGLPAATTSARVLDAGCGTGGMLRTLSRHGRSFGVDAAESALRFARSKAADTPVVLGTIEQLPFCPESFDLVTSFDVLYHRNVVDDGRALGELARVLKKSGTLLIRVPAYEGLRSRHDEAVHTRQRYGKRELIDKLRAAGLTPDFVSFANTILFPVAAARRLGERLYRAAEEEPGPRVSEVQAAAGWLNRVLTSVLCLEAAMVRHVALPFGLSLIAIARKRQGSSHGVAPAS